MAQGAQFQPSTGIGDMKHGVIIGKFDPFHFGHLSCIRAALLDNCNYVTVMIVNSITDRFPLDKRIGWINDVLVSDFNSRVLVIDDIYDDDNSLAWAEAMNELEKYAYPFTDLYGSEAYIESCAMHLGVIPHMVDPGRVKHPISATAVAADPIGSRHMVPWSVRAYFTRPIVVCGPESSGTTTLAKALADHYTVPLVPEYGRTYCENLEPGHVWTHRDFMHIGATQTKYIIQAARHSLRPFVISDTDATATYSFEKMYLDMYNADTLKLSIQARESFYESPLYIVTAPTIPFVQDGMRTEDPQKQEKMFKDLQFLCNRGLNHRLVLKTPNLNDRISQSIAFLSGHGIKD